MMGLDNVSQVSIQKSKSLIICVTAPMVQGVFIWAQGRYTLAAYCQVTLNPANKTTKQQKCCDETTQELHHISARLKANIKINKKTNPFVLSVRNLFVNSTPHIEYQVL